MVAKNTLNEDVMWERGYQRGKSNGLETGITAGIIIGAVLMFLVICIVFNSSRDIIPCC